VREYPPTNSWWAATGLKCSRSGGHRSARRRGAGRNPLSAGGLTWPKIGHDAQAASRNFASRSATPSVVDRLKGGHWSRRVRCRLHWPHVRPRDAACMPVNRTNPTVTGAAAERSRRLRDPVSIDQFQGGAGSGRAAVAASGHDATATRRRESCGTARSDERALAAASRAASRRNGSGGFRTGVIARCRGAARTHTPGHGPPQL